MSLEELQLIEQQLSSVVGQRQQYNKQVLEIDNAISELANKEEAYYIVGSVMVKKDAKTLLSDLNEKKELCTLRVESLDQQEKSLREKATQLQQEVLGSMQGEADE